MTSDLGIQFTGSLWRHLTAIPRIKPERTTSYHPQANGMVQRFHHPLKNALKARLSGPCWMTELPLGLLGLRSAWREDADCTPADLVFGTTLRLPGQMIKAPLNTAIPTSQFLAEFRERMYRLVPPVPVYHTQPATYIPQDLASAKLVYMRHDAVRGPLQRPYNGPFRVIRRGPKFFVIDKNGQHDSVTIDRLKVAYVRDKETATGQVSAQTHPSTTTLPLPVVPSTDVSTYAEVTSKAAVTACFERNSRPPRKTWPLNLPSE